ncbi:outer membrane beta-barrel protein [Flammeovirga sp. EKP202]|uniref:outer membrane beta-barrel protein n=1 Tax=Flammeovirga sp. EKP202 TaxID=2770592 RepID=UPI001CB7D2DF|nr:outer membrane beta-barrel protein [Flammeovirga sp. EKP202]
MKTKLFSLIAPLMVAGSMAFAQDNYDNAEVQPEATEETTEEEANKLSISGSVDLYYRYAGEVNNAPTSFAGENNTIGLGMANVIFSQSLGKASFVADLSFGPRSDGSLGEGNFIQNLYASYQLTDKLTATGGFMGTFVGYEVISPTANFNYTTSYLFSNGPFQNAGVKLDYAFSDKVSLMVGLFTDSWDVTAESSSSGMSGIGAQLYVAPVDGLDLYLNAFNSNTRMVFDLTAGYQATDAFYVGLNAAYADKSVDDMGQVYTGVATYLQYQVSETVGLGLRYEHFIDENKTVGADGSKDTVAGDLGTVNAFTLSGNVALGPLMVIPEVRVDTSDIDAFSDKDGASDSFTQALVAVVYAF